MADKHIERDPEDGSEEYFIEYAYTIDRETYSKYVFASRSTYNSLELGEQITITYSPSQPNISVLQYNPVVVLVAAAIFILIFVILVFVLLLLIASWFQLRKLIRQGQFIEGFIDSSNTFTDSDGDTRLTVAYQFESPESGKTLHRQETSDITYNQTFGKPEVGTPVVVLYLNDGLSRLL